LWLGFGEAFAAVAGALTGLLFVALSVKSDVLAASRSLSSRAAETLVLFMISVFTAVLLRALRTVRHYIPTVICGIQSDAKPTAEIASPTATAAVDRDLLERPRWSVG